MTAIVGILCRDGVVVGTDSSTTFAQGRNRTIEQPSEKLHIIDDRIVLAGTGQVGLGQRFEKIIKDAWENKLFTKDHITCGIELCQRGINNFAATQATKEQYGALVAFPVLQKPYLCEFALLDFQPEFKTPDLWYCSMGSAQPITDTLLAFMRDIFWEDGPPSVADAIFSVLWTLEMAIQINPGGVNGPVRIAVLSNNKGQFTAKLLSDDDLAEMREGLAEFKKNIQSLRTNYSPSGSTASPPTFK